MPLYVNPQLIKLTRQGTLETTFSEKKRAVKEEYIELLLRMTPKEKMDCKQNIKMKEMMYQNKIMEMQDEIFAGKNEYQSYSHLK
jgi:hypothetical protein